MISVLLSVLGLFPFLVGGHRHLALENLALRHQIAVYRRTVRRAKLRATDRLFRVGLSARPSVAGRASPLRSVPSSCAWPRPIPCGPLPNHAGAVSRALSDLAFVPGHHVTDLVSVDFCLPSGDLFVLVVLAHHRRRVVHFKVTEHRTAHWTAQQIVDAFPDDSAPSYLLRDRDSVYGHLFRQVPRACSRPE